MPKESGNQMNRREFLKGVVATGATLATGAKVEAQETKKVLDNSVEGMVRKSLGTQVDYPDSFKLITPEAEKLLEGIKHYQDSFLVPHEAGEKFSIQISQDVTKFGSKEDVNKSKKILWETFRKIGLVSINEYSDQVFYEALLFGVVKYLAQYGIYARIGGLNLQMKDSSGKLVSFEQTEVFFKLFQIDTIDRDEVEQRGVKVQRNILNISGAAQLHGQPVNPEEESVNGEVAFHNIVLYKNNFHLSVDESNRRFQDPRKNPDLLAGEQKALEQKNDWTLAVEVAMIKMMLRAERGLTFEENREQNLAHETGHLVDLKVVDFSKDWPFFITTDPDVSEKFNKNLKVHTEINALLDGLRYGPRKEHTLFEYLRNNRNVPDAVGTYSIADKWIIRNIVHIISLDPEHYGIKVEDGSISEDNQIVSQLDMLLDNPDLLNGLCDKVLEFHNQNLGEDIIGGLTPLKISSNVDRIRHIARAAPKFGIPTAVVAGGAYLLNKRAKRTKEIADEEANLSQGQKRRKAKKKNK